MNFQLVSFVMKQRLVLKKLKVLHNCRQELHYSHLFEWNAFFYLEMFVVGGR